jgi:rhodanese-related sulfurtransferase
MKKINTILLGFATLFSPAFSQNRTLTIDEFAQLLRTSPNAQVLDARSPQEFAINHIENAINVNLRDSVATEALISRLNPAYPSFTYSINNGRSAALAAKLTAKGFSHVYELPGGLANWVGAGYKLKTTETTGVSIDKQEFSKLVNSHNVVLVDFGSKFCGGCRQLIPVLNSLEKSYSKSIKILRFELEKNPEIIRDQKINSLPTLILYKKGNPIWQNKGLISYHQLAEIVRSNL